MEITSGAQNQTVSAGTNVTFDCVVKADVNVSITWCGKDGKAVNLDKSVIGVGKKYNVLSNNTLVVHKIGYSELFYYCAALYQSNGTTRNVTGQKSYLNVTGNFINFPIYRWLMWFIHLHPKKFTFTPQRCTTAV